MAHYTLGCHHIRNDEEGLVEARLHTGTPKDNLGIMHRLEH